MNVVTPGYIATDMMATIPDKVLDRVRGQIPVGRLGRLCGSGLQAIVSAAQAIWLRDADAAVAGGAESMSRGQYWLPGLR